MAPDEVKVLETKKNCIKVRRRILRESFYPLNYLMHFSWCTNGRPQAEKGRYIVGCSVVGRVWFTLLLPPAFNTQIPFCLFLFIVESYLEFCETIMSVSTLTYQHHSTRLSVYSILVFLPYPFLQRVHTFPLICDTTGTMQCIMYLIPDYVRNQLF